MIGAKRPLKQRDVWAIRFYLDEHQRLRDRALFDLAIDSKLRGCDIVKMKINDIAAGSTDQELGHCHATEDQAPRPIRTDDRSAPDPY